MSNFFCEQCGAAIAEGADGHYVTACEHYPIESHPRKGWQRKLLGQSHYFDSDAAESLCAKAIRNEHLPVTAEPTTTKCLICFCKLRAMEPQKELFEERK